MALSMPWTRVHDRHQKCLATEVTGRGNACVHQLGAGSGGTGLGRMGVK